MEEAKKVEAVEAKAEAPKEEAVEAPKATKKASAPKAEKKEAVKEAPKKAFPKATAHDLEVIKAPHITEKSMALMQNSNKVTICVLASANKIDVKNAFERVFQVQVDDVKIINQIAKTTTRGGRYQGKIGGFKKAIVTVHEGSAIDLFKE